MNCNEVKDNLSLYIDDELSEEEKNLINEHLQSCPECSKELEEYRTVIRMLNELPDEEPPEGYCKRLHKKLLQAAAETTEIKEESEITNITDIPNKRNKFRWLKYGSLAAAFVMVFLVYGLSNGPKMGMSSNQEMAYDTAEAPAEAPQATMDSNNNLKYSDSDMKNKVDEERGVRAEESTGQIGLMSTTEQRELKIIKSGNLYVQTKDYDVFLNDINTKIGALGGFIENNVTEVYQVYENEKLMHGSLKIRVPQESFYEAVSYLENTTEVRRKSINEKDVTKEYYEKDNKVKNLEVQEQHLRDLFEKATTVEEMLQIENELRRIRTEIDALNLSLADINDRASMSTIDLEVEEVRGINFTLKSEKGVWDRAREGFINTVNGIVRGIGNLIVNLVSYSPILIPVILIFVVLLLNIKKYWKKRL